MALVVETIRRTASGKAQEGITRSQLRVCDCRILIRPMVSVEGIERRLEADFVKSVRNTLGSAITRTVAL